MDRKLLYCLILLGSTFISALSQVLLKKAAARRWESRIREYLNAPVMGAYLIFFIATVMGVYAYRVLEVSEGTLLETTGYIFVFILDVLVFRQRITWRKVLGTALIIGGVLLTVGI